MTDEDRVVSWREARYYLFQRGVITTPGASAEEIKAALIARNVSRDDIPAINALVGNDGVWAVRKAMEGTNG